MIWLIIGFIIVVVLNIYIWRDTYESVGSKIGYTFMSLLTGFIASLFILLVASGIFGCFLDDADYSYDLSYSTKIVALKDNQNISGSYFVFSGYVDEKLYYYYAKETEFGYKTEKIAADECYIKYTDDTPKLETYTSNFKNEIFYWFAGPLVDSRTIIYCPENTITTEFNIDLE